MLLDFTLFLRPRFGTSSSTHRGRDGFAFIIYLLNNYVCEASSDTVLDDSEPLSRKFEERSSSISATLQSSVAKYSKSNWTEIAHTNISTHSTTPVALPRKNLPNNFLSRPNHPLPYALILDPGGTPNSLLSRTFHELPAGF
jgi:hypothetical protein